MYISISDSQQLVVQEMKTKKCVEFIESKPCDVTMFAVIFRYIKTTEKILQACRCSKIKALCFRSVHRNNGSQQNI